MFSITVFEPRYRDDMLFCLLSAKDALGSIPRINDDLLDIPQHYLARGNMFWLALDENSRVIGLMGVRRVSPCDAWLKRLYVKPGMKRRGVGRALLEQAERWAAEKGICTLHTRFSDSYAEAALFYPAMGFEDALPEDGLRHMVKQVAR